ncbi:uncharacterized protein M421DRAFT_397123 [Didymella exigua CBS 183.55]|uniref:Uncharacterized protein n=1 Tax=Didymella exigua CBS 183.55 TaxID=1150837 RepID=A0A6A5RFM0_9PLEO|nr:uncharacterized protein M421DRAFT_397123 [Didymella exigua CBS 183.55]KAF1926259.1 hypothetical protein M421DRAFT_397123 [Didymella exigua CBS 183.55]
MTSKSKSGVDHYAQVAASKLGTYNCAVFLKLVTEDSSITYAVRVPAHGSVTNWTKDDLGMLTS